MDKYEAYEFDRQGFLIIRQMLTSAEVAALAAAIDRLEAYALEHVDSPPQKRALWGPIYHQHPEKGFFVHGSNAYGQTMMVEDFFNADPTFDFLVDHEKTMAYIRAIVQGPIRINNSEIRIRYPGNATEVHMGGPIDHKYRYAFNNRGIDCMMVRMVYFVQDVTNAQGAFCAVPGTHKSHFNSPYELGPDEEPGMVGLEVQAGDAILFTENLRHGGFTNRSQQVRKTLHVGYGPAWMMSQNISTMDEPQNITEETLARYTDRQKSLFLLAGYMSRG
ncbi:MAG TPA: phytanoyl-CoA dioxygenase family protein [Chthonomonadaceae bacterium]|nr:phytanoyl-CoA dioxygenase family protein [Chthonomonadaceae bacterium]